MSEIMVASTTDTQESVEQAAQFDVEAGRQRSEEVREPATESAAAAEPGTETEKKTPPTAAAPAKPAQTDAEKRIEALARQIEQQQEELDGLREAQKKPAAEPPSKAVAAPKPEPGDKNPDGSPKWKSYEHYIEGLADWKAGEKFAELTAKQQQTAVAEEENQRTQEVFDAYNAAAQEARTKYPDFVEVVGRKDLKIPQAAQHAIIEAGDIGPEIAYYLGKHPEVCSELAKMSPMRAIARVGQIEAELAAQAAAGAPPAPKPKPAAVPISEGTPKPKPKPTAAPPAAPITPVGGSSSKSTVPLGELPYRDYKRLRDQEERANRRQ